MSDEVYTLPSRLWTPELVGNLRENGRLAKLLDEEADHMADEFRRKLAEGVPPGHSHLRWDLTMLGRTFRIDVVVWEARPRDEIRMRLAQEFRA